MYEYIVPTIFFIHTLHDQFDVPDYDDQGYMYMSYKSTGRPYKPLDVCIPICHMSYCQKCREGLCVQQVEVLEYLVLVLSMS